MNVKNLKFSYFPDYEKDEEIEEKASLFNFSCSLNKDTSGNLVNKIALFIINIIFMLPFIIKNFSVIGLIASLVIFGILFAVIFMSYDEMPAFVTTPLLVGADVLCFIAVYYKEMGDHFNIENLDIIVSNLNPLYFVFTIAGFVALYFGIKNRYLIAIGGLGAFLVGIAFVLTGWTNYRFDALVIYENGAALIAILFLAVFFATAIVFLTDAVAPKERKFVSIAFVVVLMVMLAVVAFENDFLQIIFSKWTAKLVEAPTTIFKWWKVILAVVLLLGVTFVMYILDSKFTPDSFYTIFLAMTLLGAKIAMSMYFTLNSLVLLGLIVAIIYCAYKTEKDENTLRLTPPVFLFVSFMLYILSMVLLYNGLWINFIVTALAILTQYVIYHKSNYKFKAIVQMVFIALETAGFMFQYRLSLESYYFLVMIFVGSLATYLILTRSHPNGVRCKKILSELVCLIFLVLCLLIFIHGGSKIKIEKNETAPTVSVEVEARGKKNSISKSYYYWKDSSGQKVQEDKYFEDGKLDLNIEGEVLTVVTVDNKGVKTKRNYWSPYYIQNVYFAKTK